ncbi:DNA repair protein RecO [Halobacteroides halobius DSM 5150]|uniref:DNA repair protein RecO n=1 Tax=Halobacteroides halobius (strain ATCC 35273 / DSM 5150 / MD-1) TaxID=748449 RepID=L0KB90_HALHC|nr:DNA repair protein RecO [Halobacteroides halobius]AGB41790.1 DNA repair protein RecO [Halobacteroides halobius DSM 5150]
MSLFDTDAIVLRHYELGEADKIIVLFSRNKGKIRVVAKGVRKTKSSLAAGLEPFTYNHILVYQGKSDLGNLSQCDIKDSFSSLKDDILKMTAASYLAELVNELTVDHQPHQDIFDLLLLTLKLLDQLDEIDLLLRTFELKLLNLLGYQPYITACIKCGREVDQSVKFNLIAGGLTCDKCASNQDLRVSLGTVKFIEQLIKLDYRRLLRLKLPEYANKQLTNIIPAYIETITEKELKTISFLDSLKDI